MEEEPSELVEKAVGASYRSAPSFRSECASSLDLAAIDLQHDAERRLHLRRGDAPVCRFRRLDVAVKRLVGRRERASSNPQPQFVERFR
jgi:hypothetical protein